MTRDTTESVPTGQLYFGIPSLDELLSVDEAVTGIDCGSGSISAAIAGPAGIGKSALALHLAASYTDQLPAGSLARAFYASTDLSDAQAESTWKAFNLEDPDRSIPFRAGTTRTNRVAFESRAYNPSAIAELVCGQNADAIRRLTFLDLQRSTAGDDWGFLNRLIAVLPPLKTTESKHLLIIDAVEGLETLGGDMDSYGLVRARRSRIAQILRTAAMKCHVVFVTESLKVIEQDPAELPEEYVTDLVVRLRNADVGHYLRRVVEVLKVRAAAHIRGEHQLLIRNGKGSTTGDDHNPDDPPTGNAYIHVVHSLHAINRAVMRSQAENRPSPARERFAGFGIKYLDNMLGSSSSGASGGNTDNQPLWASDSEESDGCGLPCSTTTALIGDEGPQKTRLGHAFIANAFRNWFNTTFEVTSPHVPGRKIDPLRDAIYKQRLARILGYGTVSHDGKRRLHQNHVDMINTALDALADEKPAAFLALIAEHQVLRERLNCAEATEENWRIPWLVSVSDREDVTPKQVELSKVLKSPAIAMQWRFMLLCSDFDIHSVGVYICTHDVHGRSLAEICLDKLVYDSEDKTDIRSWITAKSEVAEFDLGKRDHLETEKAEWWLFLRTCIQRKLICRRLEIHDMSSALLSHVIKRSLDNAQGLLMSLEAPNAQTARAEKHENAWRIRLVMDDFRMIRDTYPDVRTDPLFLPNLRFMLGRERVSALIVDTHTGRPDAPILDRFDSELRTAFDHHIYTWRVPFAGYSRVAIAAIPPMSSHVPVVVRELTSDPRHFGDPLYVDPRLELWDGLIEGNPKRVPLRIHMATLTPGAQAYAKELNGFLLDQHYVCPPDSPGHIVSSAGTSYESLKTLCFLSSNLQLDETIILTIDEFWGIERKSSLRESSSYLGTATVSANGESDKLADPHELFNRRWPEPPHTKRCQFFPEPGRNNPGEARILAERIPFIWDFGILLSNQQAWRSAYSEPLTAFCEALEPIGLPIGQSNITVWHVAQEMRALGQADPRDDSGPVPSESYQDVDSTIRNLTRSTYDTEISLHCWRVFIEACIIVSANAQVGPDGRRPPAFDVDLSASETLSCLILEMWMSEVAITACGQTPLGGPMSHEPPSDQRDGTLRNMATVKFREDLFAAIILLVEALDISQLLQNDTGFEFAPRAANVNAVASRHWYSTACAAAKNPDSTVRLSCTRLPGACSTRGDWSLAVARGSRSYRLADEALDLLSSRRANFERLQYGVGLPTRDIVLSPEDAKKQIRTALTVSGDSSRDEALTYDGLLRLGAKPSANDYGGEFDWLWRSKIKHYERDSRVWSKWLLRTLQEMLTLRSRLGSQWVSGLKLYDQYRFYPSGRAAVEKTRAYESFGKLIETLQHILPD